MHATIRMLPLAKIKSSIINTQITCNATRHGLIVRKYFAQIQIDCTN